MKKVLILCLLSIAASFITEAQTTDFRKETIYFLLISRFYDGDSTNNRPNEWCSYLPGANNPNITDPKDITWRGDFKGLIEKLDYIKDMGFTAIWINPVVQGRSPLDYHGYHAWDFTKVDTRLESPGSSFKDLIDAAHAKGLKVMLDIVTNHSGRYGLKGVSELKYNTDPTKPWGQNSAGQPLPDNPNWEYDGSTPNPDDNKLWSRANLAKMPAPYNQNLANYNWPSTQSFVTTSDPNYFHHWGNGFVQGWDDTTNCYNGAISDDCPDLNTGSRVVQDYFFNVYKQFIDWGVDAFRWDTYKHMNKQDVIALLDRFKAYKPDLFVVGEVAQKRFELHPVQELNPHWYTWRGNVGSSPSSGSSVLDFYAEATFHNTFENGGSFSGVTEAARYDNLYNDPSQLVTWLDNHDFGPNNDWNRRYSGSDENLAACMNFMFTWRGIPCVYYGTETRFKAGVFCDLHDAAGIRKSIDETGRAYYGNAFNGASNHVIYRHIKKLNAIRKAVPALQNGSWQWGGNYPWNGIGYTRSAGSSFVCVGLAKDGSASFNFTGIANGVYRDAVTGRAVNVTNGTLPFTVTSGSAGIYVKDGPGMIGESGAGFFEPCASGCNNTPPVVSVSPVGSNYTSTQTVSMSASGIAAPYTIFYTTDGSAPTTASSIYNTPISVSTATTVKAIARDANGRVSEINAQRYTFVLPKPILNVTPISGNYTDPITIQFNPSQGTPPYTIYYTTDGSTPNTSSSIYTAPLVVNTASTLKAIAKDSRDSISPVVTRSYTFNIPNPLVTAAPSGGNFNTGNVQVTLTATSPRQPVSIHYTTDGSMPTASSPVYSAPLTLTGGDPDTLIYIGIDSEGRISAPDTSIYTYYPIPDITVYFKRPATWGTNIRIHYWNAQPAGVYTSTTWPGVLMTQECGDWYKFTFSGITSTNLIFNDGAGRQTADLTTTTTRYYDNGWLTTAPNIYTPVANFAVNPGLTGTAPLTVTFNGSLSTACAGITGYVWNFGNGATNTGQTPSATYTAAGSYPVTLTITDQNGATSSITQTITVNNASSGFWVYFKKPASWSNTVRVHYWNKQPGSIGTAWPGDTMTLHCGNLYKKYFTGTTSVNLIFNDNAGRQTIECAAHRDMTFDGNTAIFGAPTNNENLFANFEITPAVGSSPLTATFSTNSLVNCSGAPLAYSWTFGDGNTAFTANPTHTYILPGRYTVTLFITSGGGTTGVSTISKRIDVGLSGNPVKIHFRKPTTWTNAPRAYFWNATPSTANTTWPGATMTSEGNNWWLYEIPTAQCANLVLNNNASPQTADLLNVCGEVWYDNGWISNLVTSGTVPVVLQSFTGKQNERRQNELYFQTTSETGLQYYVLEKSIDGIQFNRLAFIQPGLKASNQYRYIDAETGEATTWYYRIRMVLDDGIDRFSKTVMLRAHQAPLVVFPNPVDNWLQYRVNDLHSGRFIRIIDASGKTIHTELVRATTGKIHRNKSWSAGVYRIQWLNERNELIYAETIYFK
ncbi:MAG: starch-binding protein [Ferruginibacter sp.]